MDNQTDLEQAVREEEPLLALLKSAEVEIEPCEKEPDFGDQSRFKKMELTSEQKMHISAVQQHLPSLAATGTLANASMVKFPNGLPQTLTRLKQGGSVTAIKGSDGKFVGTASLYPLGGQAAVLGAFTVMSIASGQYFLAEINSKLQMMKLSLDKILEFLYGDKRAELMSEISFVKYALENYSSIMAHNEQREATLVGIQQAKKIAMKDVEFYMADLDSAVKTKDNSDIGAFVDKAFQIQESLELSKQLYVMSTLLEVYYSENYDSSYIRYVEDHASAYMNKCQSRMLSAFSVLENRVADFKGNILKKDVDKAPYEKRIGEFVEPLKTGEESPLSKSLKSVLHEASKETEYYISDGAIYLKTS